jgi:RNA polymerase sigma-70 factor (family 1)
MKIAYQSDEVLLSQLKAGSENAFDCIYDHYWKSLFEYAYKRLQSEDAAKDMVQEAFIALWNKKETIDPESSLSNYLFSILRFKLIDNYYAGKVRKAYGQHISLSADKIENSVDQSVHLNELKTLLNDSVNDLPGKMKAVFELSRFKGLSNKEISEHLGISEQTVKNQLSTAIKRLRVEFSDYLLLLLFCLSILC